MNRPARAWVLADRAPAIVLGRGQRGLPLRPSPLPLRRRASGGGAVLVGPWLLCAALRLPRSHPGVRDGPAAAARWFGELHLHWLRDAGLDQARLYRGPARDHWACFAGRGPGEVMLGDRKLAGIAQCWRRGDVLLFAGTLLAPPPWSLLCDALGQPRGEADRLGADTVSLAECLPQAADPRRLAAALAAALATVPVAPGQGTRAASPAASTAAASCSNSELLSRKHVAPRPR